MSADQEEFEAAMAKAGSGEDDTLRLAAARSAKEALTALSRGEGLGSVVPSNSALFASTAETEDPIRENEQLKADLHAAQRQIATLGEDLAEMRGNYERACVQVADMYSAATGRRGVGPMRGVVEDLEDVRSQLVEALAKIDAAKRALA